MKNGGISPYFSNNATDILISAIINDNNVDSNWTVSFNRIPHYLHIVSSAEMAQLNSRPNKATDFVTGQPIITAFDHVQFGDDIGYQVTNCSLGYFPPQHSCPLPKYTFKEFHLRPAVESNPTGCYTKSNQPIGYWVNGAAMFNPVSGDSYHEKGIWHYNKPALDIYDLVKDTKK